MKALYAGSFDPITNGHLDIILQAMKIFERVCIGVATNPDKHYLFTPEERQQMIIKSLEEKDVWVKAHVEIHQYNGMTVKHAKEIGAAILVRGLRAVSDFDSEFQMTQFNRRLPPGCNTMFLMPDEKHFYLSSTAIRGIAKMGGDVSLFVPHCVVDMIHRNRGKLE